MTLIGEGLVERRPHVGYRVTTLTFEEFTDLYEVREVLEASALVSSVRNAGVDDDARIRASHTDLDAAIRRSDHRSFHTESRRLHLAMMRPSKMSRLIGMYESAWNLTEPTSPMSHVSDEARRQFHADHAEMIDAFVDRESTPWWLRRIDITSICVPGSIPCAGTRSCFAVRNAYM